MKTKIPFNIDIAKDIVAGKEQGTIKTESGLNVKILTFDRMYGDRPIVATVFEDNYDKLFVYTDGGQCGQIGYALVIEIDKDDEPYPFKPFDKVLVRDLENKCWSIDIFSHYDSHSLFPYKTFLNVGHKYCIPYNDETKHLLGTSDSL